MTILVFRDENETKYCYSHVSRRDRDFRKSFLMVEREKMKLTLVENSRDREFSLTSDSTALGSRCYLLIMRIWREMPADDELDDNESYCFDYDLSIEYNQMIIMLTIIMIKNRERYLR